MEGFHNSAKLGEDAEIAEIENDELCGIAPRVISDIFREAKKKRDECHLSIFCSFL